MLSSLNNGFNAKHRSYYNSPHCSPCVVRLWVVRADRHGFTLLMLNGNKARPFYDTVWLKFRGKGLRASCMSSIQLALATLPEPWAKWGEVLSLFEIKRFIGADDTFKVSGAEYRCDMSNNDQKARKWWSLPWNSAYMLCRWRISDPYSRARTYIEHLLSWTLCQLRAQKVFKISQPYLKGIFIKFYYKICRSVHSFHKIIWNYLDPTFPGQNGIDRQSKTVAFKAILSSGKMGRWFVGLGDSLLHS